MLFPSSFYGCDDIIMEINKNGFASRRMEETQSMLYFPFSFRDEFSFHVSNLFSRFFLRFFPRFFICSSFKSSLDFSLHHCELQQSRCDTKRRWIVEKCFLSASFLRKHSFSESKASEYLFYILQVIHFPAFLQLSFLSFRSSSLPLNA
jgi:hypothetical protein